MSIVRTIVVSLACALSTVTALAQDLPKACPYEVGLSAERLERVGKWLQAEVDGRKIPGAVLLVARQDKVAYLESFGRHDPGAAAPMTHYPIFRIFLMTKPIASVAAMMLVEDGRLSLDDPRVRHISEFARQEGLSRRPGRSRCR